MTKLLAALLAVAAVAVALPAAAHCPGHEQMTVQTAPVVTSDAVTTPPIPPATTKTGG
jgi:hypothetical protein